MLDKSPDRRHSIAHVQRHPVLAVLHGMLMDSFRLAEEGNDEPAMQGATVEEKEGFLEHVFDLAFPASSLSSTSITEVDDTTPSASQEVGMDLDD